MICSDHFVGNCKSETQNDPAYVPTIFPAIYSKRGNKDRHKSRANRAKKKSPGYLQCRTPTRSSPQVSPDEPLAAQPRKDGNTPEALVSLTDTHGLETLAVVTSMAQQFPLTAAMVTLPTRSRERNCRFQGFNSVKHFDQLLLGLSGVTMPVFSLLLNQLPVQREPFDVTREEELLLFLMRLKFGVSLTALSAVFGITKSTASKLFHRTLDCLCAKLSKWVFVPPRDSIKDTMPECLKLHYPNCAFIIDCIEVKTEMPSDVNQQHVLFSQCNGDYTLKWLVGILPNGMVSFVSTMYGGRHTDCFITSDSGVLASVQPGDVVLSERELPAIKTMLSDKGAILVVLPFNVGGGQLSETNGHESVTILQPRAHVEKVIRKLKMFDILNNRIPLALIPHMGKVVGVCGALVNMNSDILG